MACSGRVALALAASACGSTGPVSDPLTPGIRILAGAGVSDTIQTVPVQALIVRIIPSTPGLVVRFEQQGNAAGPQVFVSTLNGTRFVADLAETTDTSGQVAVRISLGTRTGGAAAPALARPSAAPRGRGVPQLGGQRIVAEAGSTTPATIDSYPSHHPDKERYLVWYDGLTSSRTRR